MKIDLTVAMTCLQMIAAAGCFAQGVTVPVAQCYDRCPHPHDVHPCCSPSWPTATCTRFDSAPVVVYEGDKVYIPSEDFEFRCENCCKFEPDECPGNYANPAVKHCELDVSISYTESITLSVSAGVTVNISAVELSLESGVGVTVGSEITATLHPELDAPKCTAVASQPRITVRANRAVRVDHTWQVQGKWITWPGCGSACPNAGTTWIIPATSCDQDSSTAIGNKIMSATDGSPYPVDCPERAPCN